MKTVELGEKRDLAEIPEAGTEKTPEKYYPCLYINGVSADLMDLPEEGEMTIKYRTKSKSMADRDGEQVGGAEIEVRSISYKPGKTERKNEGDAFEETMADVEKDMSAKKTKPKAEEASEDEEY